MFFSFNVKQHDIFIKICLNGEQEEFMAWGDIIFNFTLNLVHEKSHRFTQILVSFFGEIMHHYNSQHVH